MNAPTSANDMLRLVNYWAQFSQTEEPQGITRLPWTTEDRGVVETLTKAFEDLGLRVQKDAMNNLWAIWDVGATQSLVIGSHRDSVPSGGPLDGMYGVIGATEVIRQLKAQQYRPRHNLEVVAWNDEEGARFGTTLFGSRVYTGAIDAGQFAARQDRSGILLKDAAVRAGYPLEEMGTQDLQRIAAYIELHIEQGPLLERSQRTIGVVTGINAQFRERITVAGIRVHAAYSAHDRSDPIFATGRVWTQLKERLDRLNQGQRVPRITATIGQIDAASHLINAVPPEITWSVDVRADDALLAQEFLKTMHDDLAGIGQEQGFWCRPVPVDTHADLAGTNDASQLVRFDETLQAMIQASAVELGYSVQPMASWAGHDAMALAPRVPSAMIFVPSVKGRSHTPEEWTDPKDLAKGVDVLRETVLIRDRG